jgi:adenylylsulfate kinase
MLKNATEHSQKSGSVIWVTGLSGSGKTTLATEVVRLLREDCGAVVSLDGDRLREIFATETANCQNYDRKWRLKLAMQYAHLCKILSMQGFTVVIATISMFREVYGWNRSHLPGYFEVYLKVPVEELRRRDSKGIYSRYDAGRLQNVAGLDLNVDEPKKPDFEVEIKSTCSVTSLASELIHKFKAR